MIKLIVWPIIYILALLVIANTEEHVESNARTYIEYTLNNIKKAPHQVSIQYRNKLMCSGTIINKNWIITAANCVRGPKCCYTIRSGSLYHNTDGTIHQVGNIIIHENFNINENGFAVNDIALIYVKVPLIINANQKAIPLGNINEFISRGSRITMYGWANTTFNTKSPLKLFKTKTIGKINCNTTYGKYGGIDDNQGCTDDYHGRISLCFNDAGGPVIYKTHLLGILSWTVGCGNKKYPNIFTEIAAYRFWIRRYSGI